MTEKKGKEKTHIGLRSARIIIPEPPGSLEEDGEGMDDTGVVGGAVVRVTNTVLVTVTTGGEEIGELEGEGEEIG